MSGWVERLFYPGRPEGTLRELALSPLAVAESFFAAGVQARTAARTRGWLHAERVPGLQVISVGNVQVGGAGKTPVVRALAERLVRRGQPVAILSRGHGRTSTGDVRVEGPPWPEPERCGDEPLMLARSVPAATVWAGADRLRLAGLAARWRGGGGAARRRLPAPGLARDEDVVVVDEAVGFGNGRMLPRGPLREPLSGLRRATLFWVRAASTPGPTPTLPRCQRRACGRGIGPRPGGTPRGAASHRGAEGPAGARVGGPRRGAFLRTLGELGTDVRGSSGPR